MKVLVLLIALANVVLFMWEYRHGAFVQANKTSPQPSREPIVLVSELRHELVNVDFRSLYPPGLDTRADNLLTGPFALEDFIGELLLSSGPQNEAVAPPPSLNPDNF
jgi:hypothetical protein